MLEVLAAWGARYRPGAPLDVRWLAGGWSSHFELQDDRGRRLRCDFFSRPPRVSADSIAHLFATATDPLIVVDIESLIKLKQSQRAKDYAVVGALASRLPPERELELTTDPDRVLQLALRHGRHSARPAVRAALTGDRDAVVVELAREADRLQQADRRRLDGYARIARPFLDEFTKLPVEERRLPQGHARVRELAERYLPEAVLRENPDADAQ